jgi:predicted Rossmann fold nucleotide-binding protein DprA/Smf involved in DNA uptake
MNGLNENGKRVAVIGSRNFTDKDRLFRVLDKNKDRIKVIVSGGAHGADSLAQEWAKERGYPCLIFYPRWKDDEGKHDRGAGFKRNRNIIESADVVLAFWDKVSGGTKNSLEIAKRLNKPVRIYEFTSEPEPLETEQTYPEQERIASIEQAAKEAAEVNGEELMKAAGFKPESLLEKPQSSESSQIVESAPVSETL